VHGYAEHSGRYAHVASCLNKIGVDVTGFDLRGHGESRGRRVFIRRFQDYLDDTLFALDRIVQAAGSEPVFLVGHSLGGLIAARFVQEYQPPLSGLIISSPAIGFAAPVPLWKDLAGRFFSWAWPTLALRSDLDRERLSHDPQVEAQLDTDPHAQTDATARWYTECLKAQVQALEDAPGVKIPLLCMLAGADEITAIEASRAFFRGAGAQDKKCIEYPELYHEIFNELDQERVLRDMTDWLTNHIPRQEP
jgi:lysophospholipase